MNEGIVNNQGYYLQKSGERVSTLLSRQYIVPTLTSPPNENTLTWKDGDYIVDFRIGEFVRVILDDSYVFYRLNDIIENTASWELLSKADLSAYYNKEEVDGILHNLEEHTNIDELFTPIEQQLENKQDKIENLDDINNKLEVIDSIIDEDRYLYSNGEKVDMRFTRSLLPVGTAIPAKSNLNTIQYLKIGKYYCSLNVDAKTITNCPTAEAFSMEVFNPLGVNVDDETTREYTYRIRIITAYKTGMQYLQYCNTSGTPGTWSYNGWKVVPQTSFTLNSSKNGGSAVKGASNRGIYIDSTGTFQQMGYTIAKSVPSNAVFTDTNTKVTSVGNHYVPVEDESAQISAPEGEVITGLKCDAAGHIVGVVSTSYSGSGEGNDTSVLTERVNGLEEALDALMTGNTSAAIESFNEVVAFLKDIEDSENLDGIIASIEQQIAEKQGSIEDLDVIRNGAEKGATALQSVPSEYATKTYVSNAITTSIINALNTPI